ncbi:MAG: acyl-CoA dehydrogenase family protein [Sphingomonadales bacterium]|nr:acyl-CoA dehydrogenase family protein [Sphingomonadales bacterium]
MSILLGEDQVAFGAAAGRLVAARCDTAGLLGLLEPAGRDDRAFWAAAVADGWSAIVVPPAYGGLGLGLVELGQVAQAAGAAPVGMPWLAPGAIVARALLRGDDRAAAQAWLPRLAAGERAALAFAEGCEALPGTPEVRWRQGALRGDKHGVVGGLAAAVALVWAGDGTGPVLALAELDGSVARRGIDSFDNSRLPADLAFGGTAAQVLASGEAAHDLARELMAAWAVVLAFEQLGGAEALLWRARDYAVTRRAFGQPIGAFQSVKHRIAELYGLVEIARANCLHAAACDGTAEFARAAAAARLSATEAYDTAARDCVQVHGGLGTTWEGGLHLHMRRARSLAAECGNTLRWEDWLVDAIAGIAL